MTSWNARLREMIPSIRSDLVAANPAARPGTDSWLVASPDHQDLHFAILVTIPTDLAGSIPHPDAFPGSVQAIIEYGKEQARRNPALGILYGQHTTGQGRYMAHLEPCTVAHSPSSLGAGLWHPDDRNYLDSTGLHLTILGAVPYREPSPSNQEELTGIFAGFIHDLAGCLLKTPESRVRHGWQTVWDQQAVREELGRTNMTCFIADGTRAPRDYTRYRSWFRVAGPKKGVLIPFTCPEETGPAEWYLPGTNRTVTGCALRRGEVFAITGSNAEGKTSLLQAIIAGEDDHAPGDGREGVITVRGGVAPDATNIDLKGVDLTPYFRAIPPGMSGNPSSASGQGSGSASMAFRLNTATRHKAPYILIDEDRAAHNLLVPCFMTGEDICPLSTLLAVNREFFEDTSLIIAGTGMEDLIARADRIIRLENHAATAISPDAYLAGLAAFYNERIRELSRQG